MPYNYILLTVFTIGEALTVGNFTADFAPNSVVAAISIFFITTLFLFYGSFESKNVESQLSNMLVISVFGLPVQCFVIRMLGEGWGSILLSLFASVLYSAYVTYDISEILKNASVDEYIMGSVLLFGDLIKIFIHILKIIAEIKKDD